MQTLDAKMKQKQMVDKSDISDLVNNTDLNTKLSTLATKAELNKNCENCKHII